MQSLLTKTSQSQAYHIVSLYLKDYACEQNDKSVQFDLAHTAKENFYGTMWLLCAIHVYIVKQLITTNYGSPDTSCLY